MKPYSRTYITGTRIHSSDKCGVCRAYPTSNGIARQIAKRELRNEIK